MTYSYNDNDTIMIKKTLSLFLVLLLLSSSLLLFSLMSCAAKFITNKLCLNFHYGLFPFDLLGPNHTKSQSITISRNRNKLIFCIVDV